MKKIIITSIALIIIAIFLFVGIAQRREENAARNGEKKMPYYGAIADGKHISYRDALIEVFHDFPDKFPHTMIDGKALYLVGYPEGGGEYYIRKVGIPYQDWGGVIVFEQAGKDTFNLLWESNEAITRGNGDYSRFQDINNDGIDEIIITDITGTSSTTSILIYMWQDNTFKIVTPTEKIGKNTFTSIAADSAYLKDLDNDKIDEIIDEYRDDEKKILHQRIYKFNKETGLYSLWKQTAEPVK